MSFDGGSEEREGVAALLATGFHYRQHRLHEAAATGALCPKGKLSPNHRVTQRTLGRIFDPTGQFFYCCNQRGDNVALFQVNRKTGGLTFTGHYTPVGNPSSIVFLDLTKVD